MDDDQLIESDEDINCILDPNEYDDDPCATCSACCDGWEARFCCTKCRFDYGDADPPCEDCDPWDI